MPKNKNTCIYIYVVKQYQPQEGYNGKIIYTYNNEEDGCVFRLSISDFAEEGVCMTLCQREGTKINPSVMVNFLSEIIQKEKERKQRNAKTDKRSTKSETGGRN